MGDQRDCSSRYEKVARLWCEWVQQTPDAELAETNEKLPGSKREFAQFWLLQPDVREYFLHHVDNPTDDEKKLLKTIELLCNASPVVRDLNLADIRALEPLLDQPALLPDFVRAAIIEYQLNKGARSWVPDRRIVPLAWQAAMGARP